MSVDGYAQWDAAYVLGSLSPSERREFERHLTECAACAAAVAELAGLPGLLAKVPGGIVDSTGALPEPVPVPATLMPRLVRSVERRRRRARRLIAAGMAAGMAAAAAAAAVIALLLPAVLPAGISRPTTTVALSRVVPGPLTASLRLVPEGWGTRLEMNCRYAAAPAGGADYRGPSTDYAMFVTDDGGHATQVATWTARPGSTVEPSGTTSLALADIRSIDVRSASDGRVLLRGSP